MPLTVASALPMPAYPPEPAAIPPPPPSLCCVFTSPPLGSATEFIPLPGPAWPPALAPALDDLPTGMPSLQALPPPPNSLKPGTPDVLELSALEVLVFGEVALFVQVPFSNSHCKASIEACMHL